MTKRRRGTIPQRVHLTPQTSARIDDYQLQHNIPSFSATVETLVRLGLEQSPAEVLAPIIVSTMRQELKRYMERLIKLIVYDLVETGMARRMASAAVRDVGRLKHDDPERYDAIKAEAYKQARMALERSAINQALRDLDWEQDDTSHPPS